jgi:hypothetical protein
VVALGLSLRLLAAVVLSPHVDEAASLLAATMVAERGLPVLPSGTVYFQGGTLSYLLAPFVAAGADTLEALPTLRLLCVLVGATTIPLAYAVARSIGGSERVGAFAALLVALDPLAVQWSAHLRMYALLQPLALAFAWLVALLATERVSRRRLAALVGLAWALTFTHVAALALGPGAVLALGWAHRRARGAVKVQLGAAALLASLAPLTLLALNRTLGSASVDRADQGSSLAPSFVGDHLVAAPNPPSPEAVALSADTAAALVPSAMTVVWLGPQLILLAAGLVAAWQAIRGRTGTAAVAVVRARVAVLLAIGAVPPAVVWLGSAVARSRYLLHVHAIGWVVLAVLLGGVLGHGAIRLGGDRTRLRVSWRNAPLLLLAPLVLAGGLSWRLVHPVVHPDHNAALAYVAERRTPDQVVIVALPAIAYLTPGTETGLIFLAGPDDRTRADKLTRRTSDGGTTDYWIGVPAITSVDQLRLVLAAYPDAWIVVDEERLSGDWAYAGPLADLLRRETVRVYEGPGEVLVLRPRATSAIPPAGIPPG